MTPEAAAWAPLALGFTVGLRHALDADHVAAVSTIATRERGLARAALTGTWWAAGHTTALAGATGALLLAGWTLPEPAARWLEAAVAAVLLVLGAGGLASLARGLRFHRHTHVHGGVVHAHLHAHRGARLPHDHSPAGVPHDHRHRPRAPRTSFAVGVLHGLAGSGAVTLVAFATVETALGRWLYLAAFGGGLVLAMTALSLALGLPARRGGRASAGADLTRALAAAASFSVGAMLLLQAL